MPVTRVLQDVMGEKFPRKFGKYHLLGPLAQGGMGALYLAATGDRGLERLLVVKTVLPHLADAEYLARFRDEAKIVVQLSHGNLIPVFDAGQVEGELFLAMEFVEGKDLRAMWNRCAKKAVAFPVDVAVYITKELCRGLAYAHSFGDIELVHRDVSPPNVLVSYSGEVKLTDFGLAASTLKLEKTAPGIIYGKVAYMSPEQARGEKLDGRSDLYASAIILWELLTGRQLFPPGKEQPQDLLQRARDPSVLAPSKRAPRVPPELDEIVLRGLAPDRDDRYANGEEFREALQGWLAVQAPSTDAARLESFMGQLFSEDMASERVQRDELLDKVRRKARTLPPTDELRRIVEASEAHEAPSAGGIRSAHSAGRRATDRGTDDDRRRGDRRGPSRRGKLQPVDVPMPGPGGATVLTPSPGEIATAAAQSVPLQGSISVLGQILDGRYRINELIGEGGMGRVYLAEHVDIGKRVAVKILHPVYGRMPDLVERFRREARAASKIGHPHIVDVTDSGTTGDDSAYFVMEYLEGVELANVIDREGAMDLTRSLRIVSQICRALAAAHAVGIIHRDLKPENIFLTIRDNTSDFVKVLDFGIAKSMEGEQARAKRLTSPGMAMGTPEYMAPEQAAGRPADVRSDVYSLGAIVYEMLTGIPPYEGDNFMEILTKKATLDPAAPKQLRPDIPEVVNQLVVRAMSRNPDERPASMEAFEYEINKCLGGRGAAVAQIIGLKTDPQLVAELNPGIQIRNASGLHILPDEPHSAGGPSSGSLPAVFHEPDGAGEPAGARPGTAEPLARVQSDLISTDSVVMASERSRVGLFGWVALGAALTLAAGVLLFVTSSEWSGKKSRAAAVATKPADAAAEPKLAQAPDAGLPSSAKSDAPLPSSPNGDKSGGDKSGGDDDDDDAKSPPKKAADKKPDRNKKRRKNDRSEDSVPSSRRQARALLKRARKAAGAVNWSQARELYTKVASGKYYRGTAYLGLAKVAFETRDTDGAIRHARKALRSGGGDSARMFLGHAYFKKARYREALRYYDAILKRKPNNSEAQRAAAAARKMMR